MIVEGGEYIGENAVWSNEGAIYNPVTDTWTVWIIPGTLEALIPGRMQGHGGTEEVSR